MADRYWVGADTSWNTSANWSATSGGSGGAGVPTSSDAVLFDSGDVDNCTLDVAMDVASLDVQSGYSGILDFADSAYAHAVAGDVTFASTGNIDFGDATITCGGNFNFSSQATTTTASGTFVMNGASKVIAGSGTAPKLCSLTVDADIDTGAYTELIGTLIITSGNTFTCDHQFGIVTTASDLQNSGTLILNHSAGFELDSGASATKLGLVNGPLGDIFLSKAGNRILGNGTVNVPVNFQQNSANTVTIGDDIVFNDSVTIVHSSAVTTTIDNSGNYDLTFQGDFVRSASGGLSYIKGTGTQTYSGTAAQDVDFDGESVEDWEIDKTAGTVTLTGDLETDSLNVISGSGLDFGDIGNAVSILGDATFASTGTVDLGDSVITCGGNFDNKIQSTWTRGTSEIILDGTSKTIISNTVKLLYKLTIDGTITLSSLTTTQLQVQDEFTINASASLTCDQDLKINSGGGTVNGSLISNTKRVTFSGVSSFGSSSVITIAELWAIAPAWSITSGAAFNLTSVTIRFGGSFSVSSGDLTFDGDWLFKDSGGNRIITFNDNIIFTGSVEIDADAASSTYTIANNTSDPDLTFQGDLAITESAGTVIWTKGIGTITLSGTAAQDIDFDGEAVEDWEIDKTAGTVTLTGDVEIDSFLLTDGTFDPNGNNLTTLGNFTQAADTDIQNTAGGGLVTVGANFVINGSSGLGCTFDDVDLDIAGTAVAHYTTATDSDASAGTEVTATDNCIDGTGNTNWDFGGVVVRPLPQRVLSGPFYGPLNGVF